MIRILLTLLIVLWASSAGAFMIRGDGTTTLVQHPYLAIGTAPDCVDTTKSISTVMLEQKLDNAYARSGWHCKVRITTTTPLTFCVAAGPKERVTKEELQKMLDKKYEWTAEELLQFKLNEDEFLGK